MIDLSGDAHVVLLVHPRMHQIESLVLKRSFPVHVKDLLADLTELRCLELTLDPTRDEHDVVDYLIPLNDLTRLSMNGVNNQIAYALASSPVLGRVRDLEITVSSTATTTFLSDRALRSIVESDNAKHLARLRVRVRVDMKMYLALMENANLPSLRHLDLPNSDLREQDLVALMDCKSLPELKSISFCASNDDLFREWKTRFIDRAHLLRSW